MRDARAWGRELGKRHGGVHSLVHGHSRRGKMSPTRQSWKAMKNCCLNENQENYPDYGGRGIKICERWLNSFENFLADMGERPAGTTLERRYVDGDYSPSNCMWATSSQQRRNRRDV